MARCYHKGTRKVEWGARHVSRAEGTHAFEQGLFTIVRRRQEGGEDRSILADYLITPDIGLWRLAEARRKRPIAHNAKVR
jgi:hypothetical protein